MRPLILGILAHVDAGKTTLSEAMLHACGQIRQLGRVDHGTAFLDNDLQERDRGITIFAKEAILPWKDLEITVLDTPGHVDFSAEMERTLQVLDYALVVINAVDGVQAHTETIWKLLQHYQIPTFLFINKMDITHHTKQALMEELQERLSPNCFDFTEGIDASSEELAMCDDALLEEYMVRAALSKDSVRKAIRNRLIVPCFFGSALKEQGVESLLDGFVQWTMPNEYPDEFGAVVYKISHDEKGTRLAHMKIVGGTLKAKAVLSDHEKVDQIRRYHGTSYEMIPEAHAGMVCAVKGLHHIQAKETLGSASFAQAPVLSSFMSYRMCLPEGCDPYVMMKQFQSLMEEDPSLHLRYDQRLKELHIQVRGEVQIEILQRLIYERYGVSVSFDEGGISYRETILSAVEGVGHYEPLCHYAEVHVLLEPLPANHGLIIASDCPMDVLDQATQRMIVSYLQNEDLLGVLTGSLISDLRITLLGGKAHEKHTSGGDFREAARRAVRQGLKMAESVLLEPYDRFRMEVPNTVISRALFDLDQMNGQEIVIKEQAGSSIITGTAPTSALRTYAQSLRSYTKGAGRFYSAMEGYKRMKHPDQLLHRIGYDSEKDLDHPTGSIFCIHGAGTYVRWDEVPSVMHVPYYYEPPKPQETIKSVHRQITIDDEELKRVTSSLHQPRKKWKKDEEKQSNPSVSIPKPIKKKKTCMIVDGYNMIFSWPSLREMAVNQLDRATAHLLHDLAELQAIRKCEMIVVFDAYRIEETKERIQNDHHVYIVYTKKAQTADDYIEKTTHEMANDYHVIVATSDGAEQNIILGQGGMRMSAMDLYEEVMTTHKKTMHTQLQQPVFRHMPLEELRKLNEEEE